MNIEEEAGRTENSVTRKQYSKITIQEVVDSIEMGMSRWFVWQNTPCLLRLQVAARRGFLQGRSCPGPSGKDPGALTRVGTRKLPVLLEPELAAHELKVGRDYLFDLLEVHKLLIRSRRRRAHTTDSRH